MPSYLAFDLGASSGRAVLGTLEDGVMRMEELHRFETPVAEEEGHLYWDLEGLWRELQEGLRRALDRTPALRSLSVDSWAVDYVPLDAGGRPLRLPYCYRDPRTNGVMERAFETMPPARIFAHTGIQFLPFNTLYQLLADQDDPVTPPAACCLTIADYFNHRFSGRAVIEVSMASTTQLMDVRTRQWSVPLFEAFGLDPAPWPPIVASGTPLGPVTTHPLVQTIAACSHDTGSAVAAAPVVDETGPWAYVSCGTWSLLGVERAEPLLSERARTAGFTNEAGLDGTIRFLKNLTGLWAVQECVRAWREHGDDVPWERLEAEARSATPGFARIDLEDPYFLARGDMPARLRAWCRDHGQPVADTRGQLVRVLLESIAGSYARALRDLEAVTGQRIETLYVFGGGSKNRLLLELAAGACRTRIVAGPAEATALGNLLVQARTMGDLPAGLTLRDVAARSSDCTVIHPSVPTEHSL